MNQENKLDKIAEDVAYMRGKWDSTIPNLLIRVDTLEESSNTSKVSWGKITIVASLIAFLGSSVVAFFTNWLANKLT